MTMPRSASDPSSLRLSPRVVRIIHCEKVLYSLMIGFLKGVRSLYLMWDLHALTSTDALMKKRPGCS
jgi:hypothetical protein